LQISLASPAQGSPGARAKHASRRLHRVLLRRPLSPLRDVPGELLEEAERQVHHAFEGGEGARAGWGLALADVGGVELELYDARKAPVARRAYAGESEIVSADEIIGRIIAQSVWQHGCATPSGLDPLFRSISAALFADVRVWVLW
jgi:hypothetical protein